MSKGKNAFSFRGKILFPAVLLGYCLFFLMDSSLAFTALENSLSLLKKIVPIILIVIVCTALLNYFLNPLRTAKHLGRESGFRGWLWALFAGVISHGPMYVWYPLIEDVRKHGMKDALVVVFFAARAVKVPLLPFMVDYFGLLFTSLLTFYILLGAILQGWSMELIQKKTAPQLW